MWPLLVPVLKGTALTGLAAGLGFTADALHRIPGSRRKSYLNNNSLFRDGSYEGDIGFLDQHIWRINPEDLKNEKNASINYERDKDPGVIARSKIPGIRKPRPNETAKDYNASTKVDYDLYNAKRNPSYVLEKGRVASQNRIQESILENQTTAQKDANAIEKIRLADDKINRQEDRFHNLQMLQAQQQQSNNQWAREIAYYDRKDEARREEKELETLIAGLTMLGANLFV